MSLSCQNSHKRKFLRRFKKIKDLPQNADEVCTIKSQIHYAVPQVMNLSIRSDRDAKPPGERSPSHSPREQF